MGQQLRALAAFPEDLGSVPSTQMVVHRHLPFHYEVNQHPPLDSTCTCVHSAHSHMWEKHLYTYDQVFFKTYLWFWRDGSTHKAPPALV